MIKAVDAIAAARALKGTSYEVIDCINFIKKIIRVSTGGDIQYTTAGTNDLWNSDTKSGKYRDLTAKQEGIAGAKPGMLAFMGVGTGDVNHVGLVTEKGTVVHSSKSRGGTVETELAEKNGWNRLGKHRMIEVNGMEKEFGNATVSVTSGYLNIREGAGTAAKVIARAENGTRVNVIREAGGTGWVFGKLENGVAGYMAGEYLVEDDALSAPSGQLSQGESQEEDEETTSLRRSDGVYVTLAGKWEISKD